MLWLLGCLAVGEARGVQLSPPAASDPPLTLGCTSAEWRLEGDPAKGSPAHQPTDTAAQIMLFLETNILGGLLRSITVLMDN